MKIAYTPEKRIGVERTMSTTQAVRAKRQNGFLTILRMADLRFVIPAMGLPIAALVFAMNRGDLLPVNFVHIMTSALWTGIDLFMGIALGPALGGVDPGARAAIFKRLTPKMTFFMPVVAGVASTAGINLAMKMGLLRLDDPRIVIALVIVAALTVQGFGLLLPSEIRILKELISERPDIDKIGRLGMRNARLGGVQGLLQLAIIFVMAVLRF